MSKLKCSYVGVKTKCVALNVDTLVHLPQYTYFCHKLHLKFSYLIKTTRVEYFEVHGMNLIFIHAMVYQPDYCQRYLHFQKVSKLL